MKHLKRLGLLLATMFALAVIMPGAASAATINGTVTLDDGTPPPGEPCGIQFEYDDGFPGTGEVYDVETDGCEYSGIPIAIGATNLSADFDSSGSATLSGSLTAVILGSLMCPYTITPPGLTGTWSDPPLAINLSGTATSTGGCPSPVAITITVP